MKITAIKQQVKDDNRVSVFVDDKYSFSLNLDQLLELKIIKGLETDKKQLNKYKKLSDEGKQKQSTLKWLLMRPHSTKELRDYLYKKRVDKDLGNSWIEEFSTKEYLNDEAFARWFTDVRLRKNKSLRAITSELYSKGISREIISKIHSDNINADGSALKEIITKLQDKPRYKDHERLVTYLVGRGFSYSSIKEALLSLSNKS